MELGALKPGEAYGTVAAIRDCPDLPETPLKPGERMADGTFEPYWTWPDGSAITVLVKAPSLEERRLIEQAAPSEEDVVSFVLETCFYCIKEPRFTREQLKEVLATKHPGALIQISDTAWSLAEFPAGIISREVRRLAGLAAQPPEAPKSPVAGRKSRKRKTTPAAS